MLQVSGFGVIHFGTKIILIYTLRKNSNAIERAEWLSGYICGELARVLSSILVFLFFLSGVFRLSGVSRASSVVR